MKPVYRNELEEALSHLEQKDEAVNAVMPMVERLQDYIIELQKYTIDLQHAYGVNICKMQQLGAKYSDICWMKKRGE